MINFEDEFVFRGWTHGIGHVSGDLRTLQNPDHDASNPVTGTHISWFPGNDDFNKHPQPVGGLQMRTAEPVPSFFRDKKLETGDRTRERFRQDPTAFVPRGQQEVVQYHSGGQPWDPLVTDVVTKPDVVINLPGMHTKAKYIHQKHGRIIDPLDPLHPQAERYRDPGLKYHRVKMEAAADRRLEENDIAYWGLNLVNMARWWQEFVKNPKNGYQYISSTHNCTGVLTACLMEGGADAYVPPPSGLIYRKPDEVSAWISEVAAALNLMNLKTLDFLSDLHQYLNDPQTSHANKTMVNAAFTMPDVMTLSEFKNQTNLRGEIRRDRIKDMDAALSDYARAGTWGAKGAFNKKLKAIFSIAYNGMVYLDETRSANHATQSRRPGVYALVSSVIGQIERENSPLNIFLGQKFLHTEINNATRIRMQFHDNALNPDDGIKAKNR